MTIIKYVGKGPRMVWGKFMHNGDVRDVNPKIAVEFVGDADFVISGLPVVTPAPVYETGTVAYVTEVIETPTPTPSALRASPPNSESANLGEKMTRLVKKRGKKK